MRALRLLRLHQFVRRGTSFVDDAVDSDIRIHRDGGSDRGGGGRYRGNGHLNRRPPVCACLFIYVSLCLACVFACLFVRCVCLSVYLSVCLPAGLAVWRFIVCVSECVFLCLSVRLKRKLMPLIDRKRPKKQKGVTLKPKREYYSSINTHIVFPTSVLVH